MSKQVFLEQYERRMVELGYPSRQLRRKAEELGDHHDFLHRVAAKEGKSDFEADAYAANELGDPVALAEQATAERRQATWWGRHPILGYIIFPLLCLAPAFFATVFAILGIILSRMTQEQFGSLFNTPNGFREQKMLPGTIVLHPLPDAHPRAAAVLLDGAALGLGIEMGNGAVCDLRGAGDVFYPIITMRNPGLGYHGTPHLLGAVGPLLVAAAGYWRRYKFLQPLPPLPEHLGGKPTGFAALNNLLTTPIGGRRPGAPAKQRATESFDLGAKLKKWLRTPTYWIVALLLGCILLMFVSQNQASRNRAAIRARNAEMRKNVWPAERAAVGEELRWKRQATSETAHETTIDLRPYINAQLSESTDSGPNGPKGNNLLELPTGTHVYGGVPFDVEGRIQLYGEGAGTSGEAKVFRSR